MGEVKELRPVNTQTEEWIFLNPFRPKSLAYASGIIAQRVAEGWEIGSVELVKSAETLYLIYLHR